MKSVLISIQPKGYELIANGKKTIEVRKSYPKLGTPFKCYIYCVKGKLLYEDFSNGKESREIKLANYRYNRQSHALNGKVIGEFVCDYIDTYDDDAIYAFKSEDYTQWNDMDIYRACIHPEDLQNYAKGKWLYGWHISNLVIYDNPRELRKFRVICKHNGCDKHCLFVEWEKTDNGEIFYDCKYAGYIPLTRPPQSWCYVEETQNRKIMNS